MGRLRGLSILRERQFKMRKILLTLLIIALLFTPWASVKGQPENLLEEVKGLVQKLQDLQNSGKYEEAIPYAQRLLGI